MAGRIYTVAQQKGGAGKTTLAAHLAIAWAEAKLRVAVVDIDPQGSLTRWFQARDAAMNGKAGIGHVQINGWRTQREVERLAQENDIVVIDSPPHAETEARIAVRSANLVIVPVQPSPMDMWATQPTLDLAKSEKVAALLVINRVPPRAKLADDLIERIKTMAAESGADVAATQVGNRVQFAAALFEGRSVTESARRTRAAEEIQELAAEILKRG
ncbi:cobyrinic acid a,c-diamide synthase [Skermanella stibiiresistens SB22]|uniref:Cobyrinic acid a,c-diamide synthase n=1 Tax=Skermanella stibiiresistens SB22 TaxID=1385369 RepID=W9GTK9_9PROT|nr:ParA family partition ATPase [Skermanella stibiiresistens]EWY36021.1 cobyrinic acid a,c-diamide synthase [Skermanella stibiiresistens SB22]